jgi:hypothetical protein
MPKLHVVVFTFAAGALLGPLATRADDDTDFQTYEAIKAAIDPGNDKNIEQATDEAATPRESLFPIDRDLRNASQAFKRDLKLHLGLDFALESTTIYQVASGVRPANMATENTTTLSGLWTPWKASDSNDAIAVGFAGETRNNFWGPNFQQMTNDIGTLWSPNDSTSDDYSTITQLWFGQRLAHEQLVYLIGKIDPGSYINGNRFAGSGNTQFFSQPFATNPAKAFPANGLGAIGRYSPVKWLHIQGVISDSNAVNTASPFTTINGQFLYAGEIALKPTVPGLGEGTYRLMVYERDMSPRNTSGWSLSFDQSLGENFGVFFRYGDNDARVLSIRRIAAAGVSFLRPFGRRNDEAGIGVSYTAPSNGQQRDEYSSEAFYRVQLTDFFELSASAQAVFNPSAANDDVIGIFGVRLRFLF